MMIAGTALTGLGISSIPYSSSEVSWLIFGSCAGFAIGNGVFMPTQSSLLTFATKDGGYELGTIMGAQEGLGALARIIGPLLSAVIWSSTVEGAGLWSYHTCFRVSGLFFLAALLLQLRLRAPRGGIPQPGGV
jgi:MFS family permease